jgi:predicted transcriptional regulator
MDAIYRRGKATVAEVVEGLDDAPTYSTVRALLRILVEKGHLTHTSEGPRYVYRPTVPREQARRSALRRVLDTFFDGRPATAAAALIDGEELDEAELERLQALIDAARAKGC